MKFWNTFAKNKLSDHLRHRVLLKLLGRSIRLHKFISVDNTFVYHGHPARAIRIILWGGYIEELPNGELKILTVGTINYIPPHYQHRIIALLNKQFSISLWIRGRKRFQVKTTPVKEHLNDTTHSTTDQS